MVAQPPSVVDFLWSGHTSIRKHWSHRPLLMISSEIKIPSALVSPWHSLSAIEPAQGIKDVSHCAPSEVEPDFPCLILTAEEGWLNRGCSSDSGFVAGFASPHPLSSDTAVPPLNHFPLQGRSGWASARLPTYNAVEAKGGSRGGYGSLGRRSPGGICFLFSPPDWTHLDENPFPVYCYYYLCGAVCPYRLFLHEMNLPVGRVR